MVKTNNLPNVQQKIKNLHFKGNNLPSCNSIASQALEFMFKSHNPNTQGCYKADTHNYQYFTNMCLFYCAAYILMRRWFIYQIKTKCNISVIMFVIN